MVTPTKARAGYRVMQLQSVRQIKHTLHQRILQFVTNLLRKPGITQAKIAGELGISGPRLSAMLSGRLDMFSLDYLIEIAHRLGLRVQVTVNRGYRRGES
jgi:predicted XRE-type DNA-binding protein